MAEEMGLKVDKEGFNRTMEEAREKARGARGKVCSLLYLVWLIKLRLFFHFFFQVTCCFVPVHDISCFVTHASGRRQGFSDGGRGNISVAKAWSSPNR